MASTKEELEKQKEIEEYEAFEASYLASERQDAISDPLPAIAYWVRWCALCLTVIVLYSAAKEIITLVAFARVFG